MGHGVMARSRRDPMGVLTSVNERMLLKLYKSHLSTSDTLKPIRHTYPMIIPGLMLAIDYRVQKVHEGTHQY